MNCELIEGYAPRFLTLFYENDEYKSDIIRTIKSFNNIKTLNILIKQHYGKTICKLTHSEARDFHNWYILHYD